MKTNPPAKFDRFRYELWYNDEHDSLIDLSTEISDLLWQIKASEYNNIVEAVNLLIQIRHKASQKIATISHCDIDDTIDIPAIEMAADQASFEYHSLFKSEDSIIEKLWRKQIDQPGSIVEGADAKVHVTDLIRTSVLYPTLMHARIFFETLNDFKNPSVIDPTILASQFNNIASVKSDPEAKLSRGYFAFHSQIFFSSGFSIEVQHHSRMSSVLREITHVLYERSRIKIPISFEPGNIPARIVSLGHLFHLAENEIERIAQNVDFFKCRI